MMKRIIDDDKRIVLEARNEYSSPWHRDNGSIHLTLIALLILGVIYLPFLFSLFLAEPSQFVAKLNANLRFFVPISVTVILLLIVIVRRLQEHRINPDVSRFQFTFEISNLRLGFRKRKA